MSDAAPPSKPALPMRPSRDAATVQALRQLSLNFSTAQSAQLAALAHSTQHDEQQTAATPVATAAPAAAAPVVEQAPASKEVESVNVVTTPPLIAAAASSVAPIPAVVPAPVPARPSKPSASLMHAALAARTPPPAIVTAPTPPTVVSTATATHTEANEDEDMVPALPEPMSSSPQSVSLVSSSPPSTASYTPSASRGGQVSTPALSRLLPHEDDPELFTANFQISAAANSGAHVHGSAHTQDSDENRQKRTVSVESESSPFLDRQSSASLQQREMQNAAVLDSSDDETDQSNEHHRHHEQHSAANSDTDSESDEDEFYDCDLLSDLRHKESISSNQPTRAPAVSIAYGSSLPLSAIGAMDIDPAPQISPPAARPDPVSASSTSAAAAVDNASLISVAVDESTSSIDSSTLPASTSASATTPSAAAAASSSSLSPLSSSPLVAVSVPVPVAVSPPCVLRSKRPSIMAFKELVDAAADVPLVRTIIRAASHPDEEGVEVLIGLRGTSNTETETTTKGTIACSLCNATTTPSPPLSSQLAAPSVTPSTPFLISREIFDTESRFVDAMLMLHEAFIAPFQSAALTKDSSSFGSALLNETSVQVFFSTAIQILKLNVRFKQEIEVVMNEWARGENRSEREAPKSVSTIGSVFLHYAPLFKLFSQYARDHEKVSAILIAAAQVKNSPFERFVARVASEGLTRGQTMESLLIQPVQRVPRYVLLLSELKRKSQPSDRGYAELITSIEQVGAVAMHVNETIRHREQNEELRKMEDRFVTSLATGMKKLNLRDKEPPRRLIREGALRRLTRKGYTVYYFHLFNDILLYSDETGVGSSQYKLHRRVNFYESVAITDKSSGGALKTVESAATDPSSAPDAATPLAEADTPLSSSSSSSSIFSIEIRSPAKSFIVLFPSCAEKDSWLSDLNRCVREQQLSLSSSPHAHQAATGSTSFVAPVWTQDATDGACKLCEKKFTLFNRRHHCRSCGGLVCSTCSAHKRLLPSLDRTKPVRVCDECARTQHKQTRERRASETQAAAQAAAADKGMEGEEKKEEGNTEESTKQSTSDPTLPSSSSPAPAPSDSDLVSLIPPYRRALFTLGCTYRGHERLMNAMELFLSEITYCKELEVLIQDFVTPILKQINTSKKSMLSDKNQTQLLGKNIPHNLLLFLNSFQPLYTLALELQKCLYAKLITGEETEATAAASTSSSSTASSSSSPSSPSPAPVVPGWNPSTTTFGELFLRYANLFDLYVEYSQNHKSSLTILTADPENNVLYKEIFVKCDEKVRERMNEMHEMQRKINAVAKKKESEWLLADETKKAQAAAAAAATATATTTDAEVTPLQTETVDAPSLDPTRRSSFVSRPSISFRVSLSSPPLVLDEPLTHTSLHDLLASPFMRVSKYEWLLSSLLRVTPEGHPDNMPGAAAAEGEGEGQQRLLERALKAVQRSLNAINAAILTGDNVERLTKLQDKFVGTAKEIDLVAPDRLLIKEGMLLRQTRSGATNYYFHLFNDILLYSEIASASGRYKIHRRLPLSALQVFDSGRDCSLEIHSPQKSFVVSARDEREKDEWLEEITLAVTAEQKKQISNTITALSPVSAAAQTKAINKQRESVLLATAPLWAKDSTGESCKLCDKKFTLFNRRHHCRVCGGLVCDACSTSRQVIESIDSKEPVRVCDKCKTQ